VPKPEPPAEKPIPIQVKCYKCGEIIAVETEKRPIKIKCKKCGTKSLLR
jgi:DNA-directed RNA polymerase subunit RPC12/RpoP